MCVLLLIYKIKEHNRVVYHLHGSILTINFTASGITQETGRWVYLCGKTLPLGVEPSPGLGSWTEEKGEASQAETLIALCFFPVNVTGAGASGSCRHDFPP